MQDSIIVKTNKLVRSAMPEIYGNHLGNLPNEPNTDEETQSSRSRWVESGSHIIYWVITDTQLLTILLVFNE